MRREALIWTMIFSLFAVQLPTQALAEDCFKREVRQGSQTFCTCSGNACERATADNVNDFHRCVSTLPGELGGQTVCNTQLQTVGTRQDCWDGWLAIDWGVLTGSILSEWACYLAYGACVAGCTGATGGVGAPACVTGCIWAAVACYLAMTGIAVLPDCWLWKCKTDTDSTRNIDRDVAVSLGGVACGG